MRLQVARVGRAHGLRGEVAVSFTSNRAERRVAGARLYAEDRELVVRSARAHGNRWLVQFEGVDDRTEAERLLGQVLTADALATDDDRAELWVHELVGREVADRALGALGRVVAVEANPAHDLLVLDSGALIPMVFVVEQSAAGVVVDLPAGLLDL